MTVPGAGRPWEVAPLGRSGREGNALVVEVQLGSTSSKGRPPGRAWLVRIRRGSRGVVVAIGLSRICAENLAESIAELIEVTPIESGRLP